MMSFGTTFIRRAAFCLECLRLFFLLCIFISGSAAFGQSASDSAATKSRVSIFTALNGEDAVFVEWNGEKAFPDGIPAATSVGPLKVQPGAVNAKFNSAGFKEEAVVLNIPPATRCAFVVYGEIDSVSGEKGLRVLSLAPVSDSEYTKKQQWTILLVGSKNSKSVSVNGTLVQLSPNKPLKVAEGKSGVEVRADGNLLHAVQTQEPQSLVLVVFPDREGKLKCSTLYR
jgi:hypothetical protein